MDRRFCSGADGVGELLLMCRGGTGTGGMNSACCPALVFPRWLWVMPSQRRRLGVRGSVMSKMRLTEMEGGSEGDVLSHASVEARLREQGN